MAVISPDRRQTDPATSTTGPTSTAASRTAAAGSSSAATNALYIVLLVAAIVAVDVLFFRDRFWERLMVNIGIVLVFSAFYFRFLKRP